MCLGEMDDMGLECTSDDLAVWDKESGVTRDDGGLLMDIREHGSLR